MYTVYIHGYYYFDTYKQQINMYIYIYIKASPSAPSKIAEIRPST